MRRIYDFVLDPLVYGLAWVIVFIPAVVAFPHAAKYVVLGLVLWGIGVGLAAANEHGKTEP